MATKVCRMPLSGHVFEYTDEFELKRHIQSEFDMKSIYQIRLCYPPPPPPPEEVGKDDEKEKQIIYAFVEDCILLTPGQLVSATEMDWRHVVNEDLIRLCIEYLRPFPRLFENTHPLVVKALKNLSPRHHTREMMKYASRSASEEVMEYLITHLDCAEKQFPIDWTWNFANDDGLKGGLFRAKMMANTAFFTKGMLATVATPERLDFLIDNIVHFGGIDQVMRTREFQSNKNPCAIEKKMEWSRAHNGINDLLHVLAHSRDESIVGEVLQMSKSHFEMCIPTRCDICENDTEVIAERFIEYMQTHPRSHPSPSRSREIRFHFSVNQNTRIVEFLINDHKDNKDDDDNSWLVMPEFLANPHPSAVQYSLEWLKNNYATLSGDTHFTNFAKFASANTHPEMILAIHYEYPRLMCREVWLHSLGMNKELRVCLTNP